MSLIGDLHCYRQQIRWSWMRVTAKDGETVTITNSDNSCIMNILYLLGAPFGNQSCSLWPHVTTLKLVAKGDFIMRIPLALLKAMINSRKEAVGQGNLRRDNKELDSMGSEA
ncbi:hypothetical protein EDB19DRAFT_1910140 [Suillus lakei]|nr:hypothetical protein EDB19DRAFT_1910140 [Suillus lakei]